MSVGASRKFLSSRAEVLLINIGSSFLVQLPVVALSFILVSWLVTYRVPSQAAEGSSRKAMFKRIDYLGSGSLIIAIGGLLIGLSFKTNEQRSWGSISVALPLALFVVFLLLFLVVEARVSREPIMPMRLLTTRSPLCVSSDCLCRLL